MLKIKLILAFLVLSLGLVAQSNKITNSRILIGSNFDFFDSKAKPSNLYGEINLFYPNLIVGSSRRTTGFMCSLYENKIVSQDTQNFPIPIITQTPIALPFFTTGDSIKVVRKSYEQTSIISSKNFGLNLSPTLLLKNAQVLGKFDASVFFSLQLEGIYQVSSVTYKYEEQLSDTTTILFDNTVVFRTLGPEKKDFNSFQFFFGMGTPFWFTTKMIDFRVLPSIGVKFHAYDENRPSNSNPPTSIYGLTSFSLMERKIGITLGGEIRGTLARTNSHKIGFASVSLYLAKAFNLDKLEDLIKL